LAAVLSWIKKARDPTRTPQIPIGALERELGLVEAPSLSARDLARVLALARLEFLEQMGDDWEGEVSGTTAAEVIDSYIFHLAILLRDAGLPDVIPVLDEVEAEDRWPSSIDACIARARA